MDNTAEFQFHGTELVHYTGPGGDVVIPNGVTSIGESAFACCYSLTSVIIPDGVTSIGRAAFCFCTELTSVLIPGSVANIGHSAFKGCQALTNVTIPQGVISIEAEVFQNCYRLRSVFIPDSVTLMGEYVFSGCCSLREIRLPDSIIASGSVLFDGECKLYDEDGLLILNDTLFGYAGMGGDVIIPYGVTAIRSKAFAYEYGVTSVTIPDSVRSIGHQVFAGCEDLCSVVIPPSVTSIADEAFLYCTNLCITIPESSPIPDYRWSLIFGSFHSPQVLRFPGRHLSALTPLEQPAAVGYAELVAEGAPVSEELDAEYRVYITEHRQALYPMVISHPGLLTYLCRFKIIPAAEVEKLIRLTQQEHKPELTAVILDYCNAVFPRDQQEPLADWFASGL